ESPMDTLPVLYLCISSSLERNGRRATQGDVWPCRLTPAIIMQEADRAPRFDVDDFTSSYGGSSYIVLPDNLDVR
ncbi:hypothetical protein BCR33DRAFT_719235, partial [Rhizoclosmatium globosum]